MRIARATIHDGVAEHSTPTDQRALAVSASERHHYVVFAYYIFSLSLSPDTWDGGAQPVFDVRACPGVLLDDSNHTSCRQKCRCITEEDKSEALTGYAGIQQLCSPLRQACGTTQKEVRFCYFIISKL